MFYTLKIRKEVFSVPVVVNQQEIFTLIDFLAFKCFETHDLKTKQVFFNKILELAKPLITNATNYFMRNLQDRHELAAILSQDLWRLLNMWKPKPEYLANLSTGQEKSSCCFHHLMLRQLRNKAINEVIRAQKPQERRRHVDLNSSKCLDDVSLNLESCTPDPLENLVQQDFVQKLCDRVDDKTKKILNLVVEDATPDEIKEAVGYKAIPAIKRRQEACRPEVISLLTGSFTNFVHKLCTRIDDDTEKTIMSKYCAGKTVEEICKHLNLPTGTVRKCIVKYRPVVMSMLS